VVCLQCAKRLERSSASLLGDTRDASERTNQRVFESGLLRQFSFVSSVVELIDFAHRVDV
jgi:hypothetical protein